MSETQLSDELLDTARPAYKKISFRTYDSSKTYDKSALESVMRVAYDVFGKDYYDRFTKTLEVSDQFLHDGKAANDLSVLFKSVDFGGSGGTYYFILALKRKGQSYFSYGLNFQTDEAGEVLLTNTNTESGYKIIATVDRGTNKEYAYIGGYFGYIENPVE